MLVLQRKVGQTIVIDGQIVLRVSSVQGSKVRVAIDAPREMSIMRGEIAFDFESPDLAVDSRCHRGTSSDPCSSAV